MSFIVVGGGSAQALLEVEKVPINGETITVTWGMLISATTLLLSLLVYNRKEKRRI